MMIIVCYYLYALPTFSIYDFINVASISYSYIVMTIVNLYEPYSLYMLMLNTLAHTH